MDKITVYEKPTCTTCRKVAKAFSEQGIDFEKVNYYIEPFTKTLLKSLLKKMGMKPSELLRKNDEAFKKLKAKIEKLNEDEILKLMIENPDLIQRPIVEKGNKAILARPPEMIKDFLHKK
ncbi:MAG: Spx/MgsR family RNA polymerase-binding regulatory protein [Ignavibacteriales bacterium]|nr:Spx/MgsR family RNA polymerase-binding regulatory protein [Ignavibacteriales bacterium]